MPNVEELPQTKTTGATPGWAYVPDTGFDPSRAPIIPTGRKRTARAAPLAAAGELSARQHSKIQQHLASLDRENNKDVQIVVPNRPREVAQRGLRGKMTPGVKKILLSQKTFANHLDDEEAMIALEQEQNSTARASKAAAGKGKRPSLGRLETTTDAMDIDSPAPLDQSVATDSSQKDVNPLLRLGVPAMPTQQELDALLNAPPLSYNASRGGPSTSTAPARQFCEICGYWGLARCMKCGARVCGLDCKVQHEETNCAKFWA